MVKILIFCFLYWKVCSHNILRRFLMKYIFSLDMARCANDGWRGAGAGSYDSEGTALWNQIGLLTQGEVTWLRSGSECSVELWLSTESPSLHILPLSHKVFHASLHFTRIILFEQLRRNQWQGVLSFLTDERIGNHIGSYYWREAYLDLSVFIYTSEWVSPLGLSQQLSHWPLCSIPHDCDWGDCIQRDVTSHLSTEALPFSSSGVLKDWTRVPFVD